MNKISLKGLKTKQFCNLLKRSSSIDNLIFIGLKGSEFESTSYNRNKSALKSVSANLEKMCEEFSNPIDDVLVKIQFANASKLITTLSLVGDEMVDIIFDIDDDNYGKKAVIKNSEVSVTVNCADKEAVDFLEIPETARHSIFEDMSKFQCSIDITDSEFKKIMGLMGLNKDSVRVFFHLIDGEQIVISEIESTDENVRSCINEILSDNNYDAFRKFDKLYDKKVIASEFNKNDNVTDYLACFNKQYFNMIDQDKFYSIELHSNKLKVVTSDDDSVKTYVVLTPVRFA